MYRLDDRLLGEVLKIPIREPFLVGTRRIEARTYGTDPHLDYREGLGRLAEIWNAIRNRSGGSSLRRLLFLIVTSVCSDCFADCCFNSEFVIKTPHRSLCQYLFTCHDSSATSAPRLLPSRRYAMAPLLARAQRVSEGLIDRERPAGFEYLHRIRYTLQPIAGLLRSS